MEADTKVIAKALPVLSHKGAKTGGKLLNIDVKVMSSRLYSAKMLPVGNSVVAMTSLVRE